MVKRAAVSILILLFALFTGGKVDAPSDTVQDAALIFADAYQSFGQVLEDWEDTQAVLKIQELSAEYRQDMLMNETMNQKRNANTIIQIKLTYDPASLSSAEYPGIVLEGAFNQLVEALDASADSDLIYAVQLTATDSVDGLSREWSKEKNANILNEKARIPQEAGELHVQTIAYDFVQGLNEEAFSDAGATASPYPYKEVTLKRFGIRPESGQLYVEIPIYRLPSDSPGFPESLSRRSQALLDAILKDSQALEYLTAHKVTSVVVAFETAWETRGTFYHTFSYAVT